MKNFYKLTALIFTVFFTLSLNAQTQYYVDGSYCPNPDAANPTIGNGNDATVTNELEHAQFVVVSTSPSSTCQIGTVYADIGRHTHDATDGSYSEGDYFFYLGMAHGNDGEAIFRFYFNMDCDESTGALTAPKESNKPEIVVPVGGAEVYFEVNAGNNQKVSVYKWVNGAWTSNYNEAFAETGVVDGCNGTGDKFMEINLPFNQIYDPCNDQQEQCGSVTLTTVLSNAGNSSTSNFCFSPSITLEVPVNETPIADFVLSDYEVCEHPTYDQSIVLTAAGSSDPDFTNGNEVIEYEWRSENTEGVFTGSMTGTVSSQIELDNLKITYTPNVDGTHELSLYLKDVYSCEDITVLGESDYNLVVLPYENAICQVLPVELVEFSAKAVDGKVNLLWSTATEFNNSYFTIEKTIDGINFETVGYVQGAGSSNTLLNYSLTDNNPFEGVSYYRLKQTDFDGEETNSDLVATNIKEEMSLEIFNVSPNPFNEELTINYTSPVNEELVLKIYNMQGQFVSETTVSATVGNNILNMNNHQNLTKGVYYVYLVSETKTSKPIKLIKL